MKKFMKCCGIIALVLVALGLVLAFAAGTVRGRDTISRVVETVTGGSVQIHFGDLGKWGIWMNDSVDRVADSLDTVNYDLDSAMNFSREHDILKGNVDKYALEGTVRSLDIDAGGCTFRAVSSGDDFYYVEAENVSRFQGYVEGETLYIKSTTGSRRWNNMWEGSEITLYVPEGSAYDEVEIELGAGMLDFDGLNAKKISLEAGVGQITAADVKADRLEVSAGMGQITLRNMNVGKLDAEVGMGEIYAEGTVDGDIEAECSMGNLELQLSGREQDFNYRLEGAMGSLSLGDDSYSGFSQMKKIDNGAARSMRIECSMGNVTVRFEE